MANPCFYTYKGKRYTYEEFATLLHDGELSNLANDGIVQGDFVKSMPEELKVINKEENLVYHGTTKQFDVFNDENGIYFTPDKKYAEHYSKNMPESGVLAEGKTNENSKVIEATIDIKNPKIFGNGEEQTKPTLKNFYKLTPEKIAEYKSQGYDGLIFEVEGKPREQVVFDKNQIKIKNETQTSRNTESNGNVRPTVEQVGEVGIEKKPKATVIEEKSVEPAVEPRASEKSAEVKGLILDKNNIKYNIEANKFKKEDGKEGIRVKVTTLKGKRVGDVGFFKDSDGKYYANNLLVQPEYRRKGIASSMYDFVENTLAQIKPSKLQTKEGKLFSEKRLSKKTNEVTIDDIAEFIKQNYKQEENAKEQPTKSNKGAKSESVDKNSPTPKKPKTKNENLEKAQKEVVKKIKQSGRTPLEKRKFSQDRAKANSIEITDPYTAVLKYFLNGGKISSDYFSSEGERRAKNNGLIGIATKNAKGIDGVVHEIYDNNSRFDTRDIKNEVEAIVNGHNTVYDIVDTALKQFGEKSEQTPEEFAENQEVLNKVQELEKPTTEELEIASAILAQMSDAEIAEFAKDENKSYEDYIKDLESRQVTFDVGPFSEKGIVQPDGNIIGEDGTFYSKESVSNVELVNKPSENKKLSDQVRKLKVDLGKLSDGGLQSNPLGLPVAVWNTSMDIIAQAIDSGVEIGEAIKRGLNYIQKNHRGAWNKKEFNDTVLKELGVRGISVNGQDLIVKEQTKENAKVVNGFYSDIEQSLLDTKKDNLTAKEWESVIGKSDEAKWTGLTDFINSKEGKISKKEINEFLKNNRIEIVEIDKSENSKPKELKRFDEIIDILNSRGYDVEVEEYAGPDMRLVGVDDGKTFLDEGNGGYTNEELISDGYTLKETHDEDLKLFEEAQKEVRKIRDLQAKEDNLYGGVKYENYQVEGKKENYKEVLVTLPNTKENQRDSFIKSMLNKYNKTYDLDLLPLMNDQETALWNKYHKESREESKFNSSHFEEPNILVHLRMNTRVDSEGKKVLFLEEIQSDWGQEGKKVGFKNDSEETKIYNKENTTVKLSSSGKYYQLYKGDKFIEDISKEEAGGISSEDLHNLLIKRANEKSPIATQANNSNKTPSAPFVTDTNSWTKLGVKVALKEAVKQGVDKIAWTTGEQQNERYDLSKQVDKINVEAVEDIKGLHFVDIKLSNGTTENLEVENGIIRDGNYKGQRLDNVIGKDYADKVLSTPQGESKTLKGDDLKVGGKGMKGFYGSPKENSLGIVGEVVKSLTKQEPKIIEIQGEERGVDKNRFDVSENNGIVHVRDSDGNFVGNYNSEKEANKAIDKYIENKNISVQHSIDITPKLKSEIEKGLPMFGNLKEQQKAMVDAEVNRIADKIKKAIPGINDPNLRKQGLDKDMLIDLIADGVKALIHKGIDVNEAVKQVLESVKAKFGDLGINESDVMYKHFADKVEEPVITDKEGNEYTSLKKAVYDAEREAQGKEVINTTNKKSPTQVRNEVEAKIASGEITEQEIRDIATAIVNDKNIPTKLSGEEIEYALLHDKVTLQKEERRIDSELETAIADKDYEKQAQLMVEKAQNQILGDLNYEASKKTGSGASRIMHAKKAGLDEDYSYRTVLDKVKEMSKKEDVPEQTKAVLKKMTQDITDLQTKIDDYENRFKQHEAEVKKLEEEKAELEEKISKTRGEEKLEKIKQLKTSKEYKKAEIEKKKKETIDSIKAKYKRLTGTLNAGVNLKLLELAPDVASLAKLYVIDEPGIKLEELMGRMLIELQDAIPDLTERDLRDLFSGYGKQVKPKDDKVAESLAELKSKARALSGLEDVREENMAPLRSGYTHRPPSPEVLAIKKEIQREMRERGIDVSKTKDPEDAWKTALDAYKTKLNNKIEYLENIEKTQNVEKFLKDKKKTKLKLDEEARDLKKKQQLIKNKVDDMVAKADFETWSKLRKAGHFGLRYAKGNLISAPATLIKIIGAVGWRLAYKPLHAGSMYGMSKVFPKLAETQGINSRKDLVDHLVDYYGTAFSKRNYKDFIQTFKQHNSNEDILFGKHYAEVPLPKIRGNKDLNIAQKVFFGHLKFLEDLNASSHGAMKNLVSLPEYTAWKNTILRNLIKEGIPAELLENGNAEQIAHQLAYLKGLRAKFMQKNQIAEMQSAKIAQLRNKGMQGTANVVEFLLPIVKIGSNYVGEALEKQPGVGLIPNVANITKARESLTEKQKSDLLRTLSYQGVGMASFLAGAMLYQNISPFYGTDSQKHAKKNGKDLPEEDESIGKLEGVFTHAPDAVNMRAGATFMWYWDKMDEMNGTKNSKQSMMNFMGALMNREILSGIVSQSPYMTASESTIGPILNPKSDLGKAGANMLRSRIPFGDMTKTLAEGHIPFFNKIMPETSDNFAKNIGMHPEEVKPSEIEVYPKGLGNNIMLGIPGWREDVLKEAYDEKYGVKKMKTDIKKEIEKELHGNEKEVKKQKFRKGLSE